MKIGIIGTGTIASAVVQGIAADGHTILVSPRNADRARALAGAYQNVAVAPSNQAVADDCDVVFIGTTADVAPGALLQVKFRQGQQVISLMAGITLDEVGALVQPADAVAQLIPFPAIAQGNSPLLVCPTSQTVRDLFGRSNTLFETDDPAMLAAYLSAQAVLSPVVRMLADTADWLTVRTGNAADAERFLRLLVGGGLMAQPMTRSDVLNSMLADLSTPGGLNDTLREIMETAGAYEALRDGINELATRFDQQD